MDGRTRGGGPTSFPRSLQWVYSNTERCRELEGERERKTEREWAREREREGGENNREREIKSG